MTLLQLVPYSPQLMCTSRDCEGYDPSQLWCESQACRGGGAGMEL